MECAHHVLERMLYGAHGLSALFEAALYIEKRLLLRLSPGRHICLEEEKEEE